MEFLSRYINPSAFRDSDKSIDVLKINVRHIRMVPAKFFTFYSKYCTYTIFCKGKPFNTRMALGAFQHLKPKKRNRNV